MHFRQQPRQFRVVEAAAADRLGDSVVDAAPRKLNNVDPQAWLADVLRRINDHPASRLDELLPWNWKGRSARLVA
jgi:IS66 C-terminal element